MNVHYKDYLMQWRLRVIYLIVVGVLCVLEIYSLASPHGCSNPEARFGAVRCSPCCPRYAFSTKRLSLLRE
jgi:hypothetical protein